ncbi:Uncharacterised protein [Mycobacteroides abscessus]|nr:Uncharacterised protein [Mycobacteroides abscessus]
MSVRSRHSRRARTACTNCSPSITGMFQSTHARSKRSPASSRSSAWRPSPASAVSKPRSLSVVATMRRITRASSMISALMRCLLGVGRWSPA